MNMQVITTITQKGQMTLPKSARDQLHVKPGDSVAVIISDTGVTVERSDSLADIHHLTASPILWPGDAAADQIIQEAIASDHH